jgi:hypothetical protein
MQYSILHDYAKDAINFLLFMIIPAIPICVINTLLCLSSFYLANNNFNQKVVVNRLECHKIENTQVGNRKINGILVLGYFIPYIHPQLVLTVSNADNHEFSVFFPYQLCETNTQANRLAGQSIMLYGRDWAFGRIYDGFNIF